MAAYAFRRLGAVVLVLLVMSLLVFAATHALPSNTAQLILGQYSTPETQAALEKKLGLDLPLPLQYWRWFAGILHGDLGQSLVMERPRPWLAGTGRGGVPCAAQRAAADDYGAGAGFRILIGGIVAVEAIFAYPGLGRLLIFSLERQDLPLMQATILILTAVYCLANLSADLLYGVANPRIRYGSGIG